MVVTQHIKRMWRRLYRKAVPQEGGVAIEFAILAPIMLFIFVFMVDLGLAIYQKMALDRFLRSAVQYIITPDNNPLDLADITTHLQVLRPSFELPGQTIEVSQPIHGFTCELTPNANVFVSKEAAEEDEACSELPAPFEHYRLRATMSYRGLFIGNVPIPFAGDILRAGADGLEFDTELQVQVEAQ